MRHCSRLARFTVIVTGLGLVWGIVSCGPDRQLGEEAKVKQAFDSCKNALINEQTDQAMVYVPRDVDAYLNQLKVEAGIPVPGVSAPQNPTATPGVDLLLRSALEAKVPDDLRPKLTFRLLLQTILDKRLLNPRDVRQIDRGSISVNGNRAAVELYYQGSLTALHLPFIKEDNAWKLDILAILPSAELLMRLDRAIKGESETKQVEQLVSKLPSL